MSEQELYNAFMALIESGDEKAARSFLIEHFNEFSEKTREEVAFAFFVDAVEKDAAIQKIKEEGVQALESFDQISDNVDTERQVNTIRDSL